MNSAGMLQKRKEIKKRKGKDNKQVDNVFINLPVINTHTHTQTRSPSSQSDVA